MSLRFDSTPIANYEKLEDGRLRVRATFSRVGPLRYLKADGTYQEEIVTAEELFREDSLATAALAPVTLGHPPVGMVTPSNYRKFVVGSTGSKVTGRQDAGLVEVVLTVNDAEAIDAIESGKARQISAGYTTQVKRGDDGKLYQTARSYNHVAIVPIGRAGGDVRVHFDSEDWAIQADTEEPIAPADDTHADISEEVSATQNKDSHVDAIGVSTDSDPATPAESNNVHSIDRKDTKPMKKWKGHAVEDEKLYDAIVSMEEELGGMKSQMKGMKKADEYDEVKTKLDSLDAKYNATTTKLDESEKELSRAQAKADTLQVELDRLNEQFKTRMDGAQVEEEIQKRLATWEQVKPFLGKNAKFDVADNVIAMKRKAIVARNNKINLEDKNDAYIETVFDTMLSFAPPKTEDDSRSDEIRKVDEMMSRAQISTEGRSDSATVTTAEEDEFDQKLDSAYDDIRKQYENAWKGAK